MATLSLPLKHLNATHVRVGKKKLLYFGGCDYFRLSWDPKVRKALTDSLHEDGLNTAASRLTTGNHALYHALETRLARFFGAPSAVLVSCGYAAPLAATQALADANLTALIDEKAHGCLVDAAQTLPRGYRTFAHRNPEDVRRIARSLKTRILLMTDALFAHDGSQAPLKDYVRALPRNSILLVDEAHSAGILGPKGRGLAKQFSTKKVRLIQTITLSKAFGVYGGAILGPVSLKKAVHARSHWFMGNTPLPLPLASAALVAMQRLQTNRSLKNRLTGNVSYVKNQLKESGQPQIPNRAPIIAWNPPDSQAASAMESRLLQAGIYPSFIQYPGGPETGFFRFAISSSHTRLQLDRLITCLKLG